MTLVRKLVIAAAAGLTGFVVSRTWGPGIVEWLQVTGLKEQIDRAVSEIDWLGVLIIAGVTLWSLLLLFTLASLWRWLTPYRDWDPFEYDTERLGALAMFWTIATTISAFFLLPVDNPLGGLAAAAAVAMYALTALAVRLFGRHHERQAAQNLRFESSSPARNPVVDAARLMDARFLAPSRPKPPVDLLAELAAPDAGRREVLHRRAPDAP
jgi:hypothetical protein